LSRLKIFKETLNWQDPDPKEILIDPYPVSITEKHPSTNMLVLQYKAKLCELKII